jgi:thiol-disulfide isomerase/thioredoxin
MRKTILFTLIVSIGVACSREGSAPGAKPAQSADAAQTAEPAATSTDAAGVGSSMPAYKTAMLDGGTFDVGRERGNVVLLNVWATWCGPCRYEIPALEKLHQKYSTRGFKVVGISIDEGEAQPVKEFVSKNAMRYPIALDPDGKVANMFQTTVIPTSVLIDRKGKIIWKKYGAIDENEEPLMKAIEAAL